MEAGSSKSSLHALVVPTLGYSIFPPPPPTSSSSNLQRAEEEAPQEDHKEEEVKQKKGEEEEVEEKSVVECRVAEIKVDGVVEGVFDLSDKDSDYLFYKDRFFNKGTHSEECKESEEKIEVGSV